MKTCINCRGPVEEDHILNHPAQTKLGWSIVIDKVKVYRCEPCDEMYIAYYKMGPMADLIDSLYPGQEYPMTEKTITIGLRDNTWVVIDDN